MLAIILFLTILLRCVGGTPLSKRSFAGAVLSPGPVDFPDPSIIQAGNSWHAYGTNNHGINVQLASSPDFNSWTLEHTDMLPQLPPWVDQADSAVWAPNVIQLHDQSFVMYFCAKSVQHLPGRDNHCIGSAKSDSPTGPFVPSDSPIECALDQGGAIDPSGFTEADGSIYIVYKIDGNNVGHGGTCGNTVTPIMPTPIKLQRMSGDGLSTDGSAPQTVLDRDNVDGPSIEAPSLVKVQNKYILFFSSGCYVDGSYDVSYATADTIDASGQNYTKAHWPDAPLLQSSDGHGLFGPGSLSIAADGQHVAFHADFENDESKGRELHTGVVTIDPVTGTVKI